MFPLLKRPQWKWLTFTLLWEALTVLGWSTFLVSGGNEAVFEVERWIDWEEAEVVAGPELTGIAAHNYIKLSMLKAYNALHNYDIIGISETFLDSSHSDGDYSLKLEGHELITADHPNNTKPGGVCIYYRAFTT